MFRLERFQNPKGMFSEIDGFNKFGASLLKTFNSEPLFNFGDIRTSCLEYYLDILLTYSRLYWIGVVVIRFTE